MCQFESTFGLCMKSSYWTNQRAATNAVMLDNAKKCPINGHFEWIGCPIDEFYQINSFSEHNAPVPLWWRDSNECVQLNQSIHNWRADYCYDIYFALEYVDESLAPEAFIFDWLPKQRPNKGFASCSTLFDFNFN